MPQGDGDSDGRFESVRREASRRRFVSTVLAASVGGLAGCPSDSGEGTEASPDPNGETTTGSDAGTDAQEPMSDTLKSYVPTVPEQSFLYEYGESGAITNQGVGWVMELCLPFREGTTEFEPSGTSYDLGDQGEVEVMTWLEDWDINPPFEWTEYYDDRTTYWDGTPMDADAYENDLRIGYYGEGAGKFSAGSPGWEVQDQWTMFQWREKAEEDPEATPNPANQFAIELNDVGRYLAPPHPDFTQEHADAMENASSEEEVTELWTELQGIAVTFFDFAENGWGSGLYEIPSVDDVTNDTLQLQAREDHPNYREETVDNIELQVAQADRQNILRNEGEVHLDQTVISENSGEVNRGTLPDHIQQLSLTGSNAVFGTTFNWQGDIGNLWVRRAIIAAVDWNNVAGNAVGPDGYFPMEHQTGMSDAISETWFSQEFLDSLYDWPMEADLQAAEQYMQNAGYTKEGGTWVRPNGEEAGIIGMASAGYGAEYVTAMQSIKASLDQFGIPTEFDNISSQAANEARDNMNYDMAWWWNNMRSPWEAYTTSGGWWNPKIVERDPDFPNSFDGHDDVPSGRSPDLEDVENDDGEVQEADTEDLRGAPLVQQVPTEVGNFEAPDEAGVSPDLAGAGIDSKEINLMEHLIEMHTDPELSEDRLQEILQDLAWYHNYYQPDFWPVTFTTGVIGNVRDYNFAPRDHEVLKTNARLGTSMMKYQGQAGLVFNKYDDEYPDP